MRLLSLPQPFLPSHGRQDAQVFIFWPIQPLSHETDIQSSCLLYSCALNAVLHYFSFGLYWEPFIHWTNTLVWMERIIILLQENLRSAEECRQRWNTKCLNLPSPQFKITVHICEECQISNYKKKDYCLGLNFHLSYKVMKKWLWTENSPDCTDISSDFTRWKQKDNSFFYWSIWEVTSLVGITAGWELHKTNWRFHHLDLSVSCFFF